LKEARILTTHHVESDLSLRSFTALDFDHSVVTAYDAKVPNAAIRSPLAPSTQQRASSRKLISEDSASEFMGAIDAQFTFHRL
jgi:hypothetical protein